MNFPSNLNVNSKYECPICRAETIYSSLKYTNCINECKYHEKSNILFCSIMKYLSTLKNDNNTHLIIKSILELYNEAISETKFPILLSVVQVEHLLTISKNRNIYEWDHRGYKMYNLLVCLCSHPWKVNVKLGKHGVCYHGNGGDKPNLFDGINYILYNQKFLKGINQFF